MEKMYLKSTVVSIRNLHESDAHRLAILANNKNISRNLRDVFPHPYSFEDAVLFINGCLKQKPATVFAIEYKGEYVGNIALIPETDVYRKTAVIGYFIGEDYWNKGIVTTAVNLICEFGFNQLGYARIHTGVFEYNTASQRVMEKCGFSKEGVFKNAVYKAGALWDEVRYAKINEKYKREN
jgi:RimJ/RimL family protein N-acetyltransferase